MWAAQDVIAISWGCEPPGHANWTRKQSRDCEFALLAGANALFAPLFAQNGSKQETKIHQCYFHICVTAPLNFIAILHLSTRCLLTFPSIMGTWLFYILYTYCIYQPLFPSQLSDRQCCFMPLLSSLLNLNLDPWTRTCCLCLWAIIISISLICSRLPCWLRFGPFPQTPWQLGSVSVHIFNPFF